MLNAAHFECRSGTQTLNPGDTSTIRAERGQKEAEKILRTAAHGAYSGHELDQALEE